MFVFVLLMAVISCASAQTGNYNIQEEKRPTHKKDYSVYKKEILAKRKDAEGREVKINRYWWGKYADKNNDGIVDSKELSDWKKIEEEQIDLNKDKKIEAKEKLRYIRQVHAQEKRGSEESANGS